MRMVNSVTLCVVSFAASAVAAAAEPSNGSHLPWEQQSVRPVVAPVHYPPLDWSSVIGTGTAAALESGHSG
jgi:hypothetical protein